jgi:hypothetical protein
MAGAERRPVPDRSGPDVGTLVQEKPLGAGSNLLNHKGFILGCGSGQINAVIPEPELPLEDRSMTL